jgi:hypothetical protein
MPPREIEDSTSATSPSRPHGALRGKSHRDIRTFLKRALARRLYRRIEAAVRRMGETIGRPERARLR